MIYLSAFRVMRRHDAGRFNATRVEHYISGGAEGRALFLSERLGLGQKMSRHGVRSADYDGSAYREKTGGHGYGMRTTGGDG